MALPPGASGSAVTGPQLNTAPETCKAAFSLLVTLFATFVGDILAEPDQATVRGA
jgi:hypothetical protein